MAPTTPATKFPAGKIAVHKKDKSLWFVKANKGSKKGKKQGKKWVRFADKFEPISQHVTKTKAGKKAMAKLPRIK